MLFSPMIRCWLFVFLCLCIVACSSPNNSSSAVQFSSTEKTEPGFFRDMTTETGIQMIYRNGEEADRYSILETLGGGVAIFDFDNDGLFDLYFPGGGLFTGPDKKQLQGLSGKLFKNLGNWKFDDVTSKVGLDSLANAAPWFYSHGVATTDYDRDGWTDLLITGYGRVALFHNEAGANGQRIFKEVTQQAGLLGPHFWSTSAAFGDFDGDGYPDLYLCQYVNWSNDNDPKCPPFADGYKQDVCSPKHFAAQPHALYRNRQNGTFEDVTKSAGIRVDRPDQEYGKGLGVVFVDVDLDGKADIYVANDMSDNLLYLNRSQPGKLVFEDKGGLLGVARDGAGLFNGSMGVDAADFEGIGRASIWVTNYENEFHALYRNRQTDNRMMFNFYTAQSGLGAIGPRFVGFGTAFLDYDNDGWEDIVITNGHVIRHSPTNNIKQRPILFHNSTKNKQRFFVEESAKAGPYFQGAYRGRGLAVGDLDNDGRVDIVFAHVNEPARILKNEAPIQHWIGLDALAKDRADVCGGRVTIQQSDRTITQFFMQGRSYLSASDPRKLIGLGQATTVGRITIYWPCGSPLVEHWDGLKIDQYHSLKQGTGKVQ